jgi:hypothetical protein
MNPIKIKSIAEKEPEARKKSVLLKYAYLCTPPKGTALGIGTKIRPELWQIFLDLVDAATRYKRITGRHLPILGELGEVFAEIYFGLKRHAPMTQGSDGKLGNEFVEVKTITPDKRTDIVEVKLAGNFGKLVVVKISDDFQFGARMVSRGLLKKKNDEIGTLSWDAMIAGEPEPKIHSFPYEKVTSKQKRQ